MAGCGLAGGCKRSELYVIPRSDRGAGFTAFLTFLNLASGQVLCFPLQAKGAAAELLATGFYNPGEPMIAGISGIITQKSALTG